VPRLEEPLPRKAARALRLGGALRLAWAAAPRYLVVGCVLWFLQGLLPLVALVLLKRLVDAAAALPARSSEALVAVALLGAVALAAQLCQSLGGFVAEVQAQRVADHVAEVLHAKSLELDLEYYDDPHYYDSLHRAQQEAPYRPARVVADLARLAQAGVTVAAIAGLLLSLHWALGLVLVASTVPALVARVGASRARYAWSRARTEDERRTWYYQQLLIDGPYAKELRAFGFGPTVRGWFRDARRRLRTELERLLVGRLAGETMAQALAVVAVFGALAYLTSQTLAGRQSVGSLVLYYTAVQRGLAAFQELASALAGLYEGNLFLANFFEFLGLPSRVGEPPAPQALALPVRQGFRFERVGFGYPRAAHAALTDVSLAIRPGEVVALVGENGAGKTTLVKLLCRLYDPSSGRVTLDGVPLPSLSVVALRRGITVAFQDYARYNLTARENVMLSDPLEPPSPERLARVLRWAGAERIVDGLPSGPDTLLGHWLAGGSELSQGEWQRVALARALWREAWLLVLDEPTSAMDPEAESRFLSDLRPALAGRSALLISHRFSTVRQADRIYVLEGGRVVEEGDHASLVALGGTYARLYRAQARFYG
jgi:ATP-binding cassette subfamily B protein